MSKITKSQRRLLRHIAKWGDAASSYAEEDTGCQGAAFAAVLAALYRKDLVNLADDGRLLLTARGETALYG